MASKQSLSVSANPPAKAFLLALLTTTGPRAGAILIALARGKRSRNQALEKLHRLLLDSLSPHGFPSFCAIIVAGSIAFQSPVKRVIDTLPKSIRLAKIRADALSKFIAALVSSIAAFRLINSVSTSKKYDSSNKPKLPGTTTTTTTTTTTSSSSASSSLMPASIPPLVPEIETPLVHPPDAPRLAGKTLDVTLFTFVRALDASIQLSPSANPTLAKVSSPGLFIISCAFIMHAFFYAPTRLPFSYVAWIKGVAGVDIRLLQALRHIKTGQFVYGKETGMGELLRSYARDLGMSEEVGDPSITAPIPCEMVHDGVSKSCEIHAAYKFARSMATALGVYIPLQGLVLLKRLLSKSRNVSKLELFMRTIKSSLRSSAFLASFITFFYYGVCLCRTRIGPKLFPKVSWQQWDSGLGVLTGCIACGWSVLWELPKRQTELMLFVVPKAMSAIAGRKYPTADMWKEETVFALSSATLLTICQMNPQAVRGFYGSILTKIVS